MRPGYITDEFLSAFIHSALSEDIGAGDHTTQAILKQSTQGKGRLVAKEDGIISGIALARSIYLHLDPGLRIQIEIEDGRRIRAGQTALTVEGDARAILSAERLVLNCVQRMSGIATATQRYVQRVVGTRAQILDTRKTTPGFRLLEKWAVLLGGGHNHRLSLHDMILIKDNHVDLAGGVEQAIRLVKEYMRTLKEPLQIEIEARTLDDVEKIMAAGGVDVILLDNMDVTATREAVRIVNGRCLTEASGGITEANIRDFAACGVDRISVGALTHSAISLDMNLKLF